MFGIESSRWGHKLLLLRGKLEVSYYEFRKKYQNNILRYLKITDISFLSTYLASVALDASVTLHKIQSPSDESHPFASFMMEKYGVQEGLLRVQGIEALQLSALLGFSHIIVQSWRYFKGEDIDAEVRLGLVYVYLVIGISKHIQGVFSWL